MEAMETKKAVKEVVIKLDDFELIGLARKIPVLRAKKGALESELGRVKTAYKGRIEEMETELTNIYDAIRDGQEKRVMEVEEIWDYTTNSVETRSDGKTIDRRAMTGEERQIELGLDKQRELNLKWPIDLNNLPDGWTVALPDPVKIGDEVHVPGDETHPTIVKYQASSWKIDIGEAATFVVKEADVFGEKILSYELK